MNQDTLSGSESNVRKHGSSTSRDSSVFSSASDYAELSSGWVTPQPIANKRGIPLKLWHTAKRLKQECLSLSNMACALISPSKKTDGGETGLLLNYGQKNQSGCCAITPASKLTSGIVNANPIPGQLPKSLYSGGSQVLENHGAPGTTAQYFTPNLPESGGRDTLTNGLSCLMTSTEPRNTVTFSDGVASFPYESQSRAQAETWWPIPLSSQATSPTNSGGNVKTWQLSNDAFRMI